MTLQQLQQEGAKPNTQPTNQAAPQKLTLAQLQAEGAMPQSQTPSNPSFFQEEGSNINQALQDRADFRSGQTALPEALLRTAGDVSNTLINTPAKHLVNAVMTPYNKLAEATPVNSMGYHVIPTAEDAARGFQESGLGGAVDTFSQNNPRLARNLKSGLDIGTGVLTGTAAIRGVQNLLAPNLQKTLMDTGVATESTAPQYSDTIQNRFGVSDLSDSRSVAIGDNNATRLINTLRNRAAGFAPDPISGELPAPAQALTNQANYLDSARQAMLHAAGVPAASPGLLSRLAVGAGRGTLGTLKRIAELGVGVGSGIGIGNMLGGSPLLQKLNPFK